MAISKISAEGSARIKCCILLQKGTVYSFDGGKLIKGRKRHFVLDYQGFLIAIDPCFHPVQNCQNTTLLTFFDDLQVPGLDLFGENLLEY